VSVARELADTFAPPAGDRHGPLVPMMVALTFVTGVVDATSYLELGHVFVANMTGNVVFLGFALAGAKGLSAPTSLVALAAFIAGALLGGRVGASENRARLLRAACVTQAALLAVALLVALAGREPVGGDLRYALIVPMALAMGVQNAAAQRLAVPDLTTTVLTRTLTGLASDATFAGGSGAKLGRRAVAVAAMLLGALAGALLVRHASIPAALALATALVLAVGIAVHVLARPGAAWL
jgi:uncharacterized membrane protein YoaK (UPF0700 family)